MSNSNKEVSPHSAIAPVPDLLPMQATSRWHTIWKRYRKILPIHLQEGMMRKDST